MKDKTLRLRRARSRTDLVWVAEKSRVCLDLGRFSTMAFNDFSNPMSSNLSASSRTVEFPRGPNVNRVQINEK